MPPAPHGFNNLGGLDKPIDARDVVWGKAVPPAYTHPAILTDSKAYSAEVEYQGGQPACGAHAGAKNKAIRKGRRFSPRFQWWDIKTFDGLPIDSGTDLRSILKSLTKDGALDYPLMGNDVALDEYVYAHPPVTPVQKANAAQYSGDGYGFIADKSFEGLKQFIYEHGPSIVLLRVGSEWWTAADGTTSWQEKDILPLRTPKQVVSGHFVLAHSYDEKYIYFINSWSERWGRAGHGYFGADYMPFVNDCGTLFGLAFGKDLYKGMVDPDVYKLQVLLNKNPQTQIAPSGTGSPGQETDYFGALTFAAVKKFQTLHNITPVSGYVGPLTRAALNMA